MIGISILLYQLARISSHDSPSLLGCRWGTKYSFPVKTRIRLRGSHACLVTLGPDTLELRFEESGYGLSARRLWEHTELAQINEFSQAISE